MTGGASGTARLQYLSAPEPGGHQPRNRHDVNDPLLLALQKELTSNLLWVLVFLLLPQQSAQWAPKRMGRCRQMAKSQATWWRCTRNVLRRRRERGKGRGGWPGQVGGRTSTTRLLEKKTWGRRQSESQEGNLLTLHDDPPRVSSCRDNLQKPVAPRRQVTPQRQVVCAATADILWRRNVLWRRRRARRDMT